MKLPPARLLVTMALLAMSAGTISALPNRAAARRVEVQIDARMGGYTPRLITVERGDTVHLVLRAMDTAHGFKVLGRDDIDITAMPGQTAEVTFVVDWEGGREWFCTFNCGPQHGAMTGVIVSRNRSDS